MVVWGIFLLLQLSSGRCMLGFFFEIIKTNKRIGNKPSRCREQNIPAYVNRVGTLRSRVSDRSDFPFNLWIICS